MNFKEIYKIFGMDSAGLGEVLMVTCCELRDEPSVFTKELEIDLQVVRLLSVSHEAFSTTVSASQSLYNKFLTRHLSSHRRVRKMVPWGPLQ